jgi:hypothetical protein
MTGPDGTDTVVTDSGDGFPFAPAPVDGNWAADGLLYPHGVGSPEDGCTVPPITGVVFGTGMPLASGVTVTTTDDSAGLSGVMVRVNGEGPPGA